MPKIPIAEKLDDWGMARLQMLADAEDKSFLEQFDNPGAWRSAIDHVYHLGRRQVAVRGYAGHFSGTYDPNVFWSMLVPGGDFAIEVPLSRWDHSAVYDPEASVDQWKDQWKDCDVVKCSALRDSTGCPRVFEVPGSHGVRHS